MDILAALNLEQLGTTGIIIAWVVYLYTEERKERKVWQERTFTVTRETQKEITETVRVLDAAMTAIRGS